LSLDSNQCYKLLGLGEGASINEIKDAYRKLALEYHPDKNISAKDGVKFKMIVEAYHTLRVKNNVHARPIYEREYHNNENHQYRKGNFPAWLNLPYSKMHYMYTRYAQNVLSYYLKYEPISRYYAKVKRNTSIIIHRSIGFFQHGHIGIFFRITTESSSNLAKIIIKTIRW
jgi:preprotein translocase subunit Sec63